MSINSSSIRLVAGLGNPGRKYQYTRHNVGFMVIDELAQAYSINLSETKFGAQFGRGVIENNRVILVKPVKYMNRSGGPVRDIAGYYKIQCEEILVMHDDIDLTFERLKIKMKGGHGGHNGVRSLIDAFGEGGFARLRIGIGRSAAENSVVDHVLGRFSNSENNILTQVITRAKDAAVTVVRDGISEGMNRFN